MGSTNSKEEFILAQNAAGANNADIRQLANHTSTVALLFIYEELQEQALEIKNDSAAKYDFEKMDKPSFWVKCLQIYPRIAEAELKLYLPFSNSVNMANSKRSIVKVMTVSDFYSYEDVSSQHKIRNMEPRVYLKDIMAVRAERGALQ
ncbi:unnamed protein product [Colias eurytheme]|nr:unnamed protein product [Colias eurytheme]